MKIGLSVKIDVTKIDKARLFKGEKGTYLDLTTFIDIDTPDQYDNHGFISQSVSKEEREQKMQTPILGNCRVFYKGASEEQRQEQYDTGAAAAKAAMAPADDFDQDIPF
jgi:hypothetical protein